MSLFIMGTGNNFFELSNAAANGFAIDFKCIKGPSYEDYVNNGYQTIGCGNKPASLIIFFTYAIIIPLIFLNLFIAIILQGYEDMTKKHNNLFNS